MKGSFLQETIICKSNLSGANRFTISGVRPYRASRASRASRERPDLFLLALIVNSLHDQFAVLIVGQHIRGISGQAVTDILFQPITRETAVMAGVLCL
jgi:hypothetical protein